MDLKLFFEPVEEDVLSIDSGAQSLLKAISVNKTGFVDYKGLDIAILGLGDFRGAGGDASFFEPANNVRRKLYALQKGMGAYRILDLGNLRSGPTLEDTYQRIQEVCNFLMENEILPLLVGGSHDLDIGQYHGYEEAGKLVSLLNIDAYLDLKSDDSPADNHIYKILLHEPNYLFNYNHLAYQSYFVDQSYLDTLEKLSFSALRLGQLREDFKESEPVIREADMLSFDIGAIKKSYCPGSMSGAVFGLTGEEACQISWYAGQNDKLSSAGFYGYDAEKEDEHLTTATVIATMLWYFVEGFYQRKGDKIFRTNDFINYTVTMDGNPSSIVFFKSKKSEKWWMEVPGPEDVGVYSRNAIVPCSYADYETAMQGDLPDRWTQRISKLM